MAYIQPKQPSWPSCRIDEEQLPKVRAMLYDFGVPTGTFAEMVTNLLAKAKVHEHRERQLAASVVVRDDEWAARKLLSEAGLPSVSIASGIARLMERERRSVLDARQACAAAVDLVAARFEKVGMVDAAAVARECAVVVRLPESAGYRVGVDLAGDESSRTVAQTFDLHGRRPISTKKAEVHIRPLEGVDLPAAIANGRLDGGVMDALRRNRDQVAATPPLGIKSNHKCLHDFAEKRDRIDAHGSGAKLVAHARDYRGGPCSCGDVACKVLDA